MLADDNNERLFYAANAAWEAGDLARAFELFREGAQNGDPHCQNSLGVFYESGYGTRRNDYKAMYWYRKSARNDNSCAIPNIADLYRKTGRGAMARQWFERAVRLDSGDGDACLELAQLYMDTGSPAGKKIRRLLRMTSRSRNVTPYGREEAGRLLRSL